MSYYHIPNNNNASQRTSLLDFLNKFKTDPNRVIASNRRNKESQHESYPEEINALKQNKNLPKQFNPYIHSDLSGRTVEPTLDYATLKICQQCEVPSYPSQETSSYEIDNQVSP